MSQYPSAPARLQIKQLALCVAFAIPAMVQAQQATPTVTLPEVKVQANALGETTEGTGSYTTGKSKTSTPLSMSLRDTPQSVSVVTQQRIEDQGLLNITDVLNNVTGVSVNQYETSRGQFTARGFDINTIMIDGVPTTWDQPWSSGEIFTSLATYDRVEVVRGSTGLTTGAGEPSGAVNLVRKRASSKELTGTVELGIGSWNQVRTMGDVSFAVNEAKTLRGRVVAEYQDRDSYIENLSNKNQTIFATMEADLSPNTLLTLGLSRQENNAKGSMWGGLPVWYADGGKANWDRSKTSAADWTRWDTSYENYFGSLEHRFDNDWKLKASYSHGDRKADSYLLYLSGAPDRTTGLGMFTFPGSYNVRTKQDDFALQASGPFQLFGRKHELAVGYTYSKQKFNADSRTATPGGGLAPDFNDIESFPEPSWSGLNYYGDNVTKQQAIYGAARFSITDPLKLILGARVTSYKKSGDGAASAPFSMSFDHEVTPYAGLVYDINETYSAYASYTDIFRPQQNRDINGKYLDPVQGKSTEAGIKAEFLDGRLNGSFAVFQIKQDNLAQSTGVNIPGTVPPETAYRSSEGATSDGFELDMTGELSPGWNVSAGYSQYKLKDANGADINSIYPRKLIRLFTSYRLKGELNAVTLGGGVNWQGTTYTNAANPLGATERIQQDSYALVNLMARVELNKQTSLQLNLNNLLDEKFYGMFDAYSQYTWGAPRNVTASVRYKF